MAQIRPPESTESSPIVEILSLGAPRLPVEPPPSLPAVAPKSNGSEEEILKYGIEIKYHARHDLQDKRPKVTFKKRGFVVGNVLSPPCTSTFPISYYLYI